MSAGVMMAKVIWNMKKAVSGIFVPSQTASRATDSRKTFDSPPMKALPASKASE